MLFFQASLISGFMFGIEIDFHNSFARMPYRYSIIIDVFIVRLIIQKIKHVR